jgi:hypothetical protein
MRVNIGMRRRTAVALAGLSSLLVAASAHAAGSAASLSSRPIAADPGWTRYVEAPTSPVVRPVRVVSTTGDVSNPDALLQGHSGSTTLTYPQGGTAPVLVLDYGKEVGGSIHFTVASTSGSPTLQSSYSEVLANLTSTGDGGPQNGAGSGSANRYDSFTPTGASDLTGVNLQGGERYEMVTLTNPGTVALSSATIKFATVLQTASRYRGYFLSDSDLLNRIWYAGAYTLNLTQVDPGTPGFTPGTTIDTPNLVDGAKRDRDVWIGDLTVAGRTALDAFGDAAIPYVKGSLTLLGDYPEADAILFSKNRGDPNTPGPMPGTCSGQANAACAFYSAGYSMDFVLGVYEYYLYTGDQAFLAREWPMVQRELAWEHTQIDLTGLFSTTALDSADWDTNFTHPAGDYAANSILHYKSLIDGAALAKAVGNPGAAQTYLDEAAAVKAAINRNLWDPGLGAYDASTVERGFLVQDANVWAVLYGVASPAQSQLILQNLDSGLASPWGMLAFAPTAPPDYTFTVISPYIGSFALWADYQAGRPDLGLALMQTEWGWMVNHDPGGTDWERIQVGGTLTSQSSAAHGWGTGATSALSQYVLGVQPVEPGFRSWRVQPQPYGLNWAQGTVPTPYGAIASRWQVGTSSSSFKLTAAAPNGTSGTVAVPLLGAPRVIAEDGRVVWKGSAPVAGTQASTDGTYVFFPDVTGTHTWAW